MANKSIVVYGGTLAGTTGLPISWMPMNKVPMARLVSRQRP